MYYLFFIFCLISTFCIANTTTFEDYKNTQSEQNKAFKNEHKQNYNAFREAYLSEFDDYRNTLLAYWSSPVQTSTLKQIKYSEDKKSRLIIDEQTMLVTLETLNNNNIEQLTNQLLNDVNLAPLAKTVMADSKDLIKRVEHAKVNKYQQYNIQQSEAELKAEITAQYEQSLSNIDKDEQLQELQISKNKRQLTVEKKQRVNKLEQSLKTISKDITYKNITAHTFSLPNKYLQNKVAPYLKVYQQYDKEKLPLLLAISHAESSFNPRAQSHIPAFGLMQIVPQSAGLDVARKHLKKNTPPTSTELFDPSINITYGSGYLAILSDNYLKKITDPISRKYCMIAAYNTGAGNVAKAFNTTNSRNISSAITIINELDSESVYKQLLAKLPYNETKTYLKKVVELDDKYQTSISQWNLNNKEIVHEK